MSRRDFAWRLVGMSVALCGSGAGRVAVGAVGGEIRFSELMNGPAPQVVRYREGEDSRNVLRVYRPGGVVGAVGAVGARPALVLIHGGAWVGGTPDAFDIVGKYFAARGMVAVNVTYRHAKGSDRPGENVPIEVCVSDCREAVGFVRAHAEELGIDPGRIAVMGESAGGHLAAGLVTGIAGGAGGGKAEVGGLAEAAYRPGALILVNPVLDLTEDGWPRFAAGGAALADRKRPFAADEVAMERARRLSPLLQLPEGSPVGAGGGGLPPTLIMHGDADKVVRPEQAKRMAEGMRARGADVTLELIAGAPHAFILPAYKSPEATVVEHIRRVDAWLAGRGYVEGPPTLEVSKSPAWTVK